MRHWMVGLGLVAGLAAQERFEVASVKAAHGGPVKIQSDPGMLTIGDTSLDAVIRVAFGLREYQYEGPAWLHTTRYDMVARTGEARTRAVQLAMLRELLADRFKLTVHRELKTLPVYELVVGKDGPKLHALDASAPAPFDLYSNFSIAAVAGDASELRGVGSLGQLCDFLGRVAGRPVVDKTGIAGSFEFKLLCAIDGFPRYETSPMVFDAVQRQMGLKLEARNSPVEVTVVDHVEKPAED